MSRLTLLQAADVAQTLALAWQGKFKPGQTVSVDSDPLGTTLVFSADGEAVVADASDRRDARRRDEDTEPVGAGTGSSRGGGRRRSVLDLPDTEPDRGDGGRPN